VENSADEERIISDVRAKQEGLFGRNALERDEHIANVLVRATIDLVWLVQLIRARKGFQKRANVIAQFSVEDSALLQNVAGEHVKIKLRGDVQVCRVGKNGIDQSRMIENGIARFGVTQKIDKGDVIGLRTGKSAHDEIEIRRRKSFPTICPNHREPIISIANARWQAFPNRIKTTERMGFEPKMISDRSRYCAGAMKSVPTRSVFCHGSLIFSRNSSPKG